MKQNSYNTLPFVEANVPYRKRSTDMRTTQLPHRLGLFHPVATGTPRAHSLSQFDTNEYNMLHVESRVLCPAPTLGNHGNPAIDLIDTNPEAYNPAVQFPNRYPRSGSNPPLSPGVHAMTVYALFQTTVFHPRVSPEHGAYRSNVSHPSAEGAGPHLCPNSTTAAGST